MTSHLKYIFIVKPFLTVQRWWNLFIIFREKNYT